MCNRNTSWKRCEYEQTAHLVHCQCNTSTSRSSVLAQRTRSGMRAPPHEAVSTPFVLVTQTAFVLEKRQTQRASTNSALTPRQHKESVSQVQVPQHQHCDSLMHEELLEGHRSLSSAATHQSCRLPQCRWSTHARVVCPRNTDHFASIRAHSKAVQISNMPLISATFSPVVMLHTLTLSILDTHVSLHQVSVPLRTRYDHASR